ncbi:hypothetical protein [Mycobacterium conspicuum]|uniref:Uncharacterized protein n=1 Tax=Mycobacterium conspicuum TaxID=44010 RepID=A0A1X1STA1_9MYCO|nr:hypothetical protein [Mycobacterium conspicuum]ORV33947.1 hypothetical protein AWC00_26665 [Mycobacterium conspicuum]BBZ38574.1 hypothetical protein MCNS_16370 [Mycobacterium conspicuum]
MTTATDTQDAAPAPTSTDTAETPTAGTEPQGLTENGSQPESDTTEQEGEPKGRAANYRKRAQDAEAKVAEVEAQSAELTATVERLQRLHVEQVVTATGLKPAAVFAVAELADLLDEQGLPDHDKITAAITAAQEQLGAARRPEAVRRERQLLSGAGAPPTGPKPNAWAGAFGPRDPD